VDLAFCKKRVEPDAYGYGGRPGVGALAWTDCGFSVCLVDRSSESVPVVSGLSRFGHPDGVRNAFGPNAAGLALVSILWAGVNGLSGAAIMIVLRLAPREAVGSVSSSAAFINNVYIGMIVFISGFIIEHTGRNYHLVFFIGVALSGIGYGILLYYRWLMKPCAMAQITDEMNMDAMVNTEIEREISPAGSATIVN